MKKFAAMILALCLCFGAAGAMAFSLTGLETESVMREWETNLFFQRMTKMTGIETTPKAVYSQKDYDKLLASLEKGEVTTDALFKAKLSRAQEIALLDCGALIDLAPYIEANMPNLSALLEANPVWRDVITLEDGRIASLPLINEAERQVCVWINKTWLDKLGVAMPQNLDELTAALEAFKALIGHILEESDASVALIPHVTWAHDSDLDALGALKAEFADEKRVFLLPGDLNAMQLKGYIARLSALVTARTHASIAAYSTAVPTLVIGYSVKARGIARDLFGDEEGHLIPVQELASAGQLIGAYDAMMARAEEEKAYLEAHLPAYTAGMEETVKAILSL